MTDDTETAKRRLREAWDQMISELERARDAIDEPSLLPPPASDRLLAEGYRYLMGFVHGATERAFFSDPELPTFRHALQLLNKGTIDNPDAIYFVAPIDGRQHYWLRGRADASGHWRGEPAASGRRAPCYLIFEATDGCLAGDTGSLAELQPGLKAQTDWLDSSSLAVDSDGGLEILLAPERPAGYEGNFLCTHRRTKRPGPDGGHDRHACYVSGRQLFLDWEHEVPIHLTLTRVGGEGQHPPPATSAAVAGQLQDFGAIVRGQMHFWNQFYTILLETHGKREGGLGDPRGDRFMPRNGFNPVNAASGATGGGQASNLYAGGVFELAEDEALIVESHADVPPQFQGFALANLWGESLDFANHQSSLNGSQAEPDADGSFRYVVAHRDPGVPNWVDTTGHREGFLSPRWSYSERPPEASWPRIRAWKVPFAEIRQHLPAQTRTLSPDERRERIRVRQEHVRLRYRAF